MIDKRIIEELAIEELVDANTKHPPTFNSMHEAYAVIKEEVEEMQEDMKYIESNLELLWRSVKADDDGTHSLMRMKKLAITAVQEGIQVIAMCDKALRCTEK